MAKGRSLGNPPNFFEQRNGFRTGETAQQDGAFLERLARVRRSEEHTSELQSH